MPESNERGALTEAVYYILLSLYTTIHSYGIIKRVEELSKGRVIIGAGTLYGALNTLIDKQWITVSYSPENDRKEYSITKVGKRIVKNELIRLAELLQNGKLIAEDHDNENH